MNMFRNLLLILLSYNAIVAIPPTGGISSMIAAPSSADDTSFSTGFLAAATTLRSVPKAERLDAMKLIQVGIQATDATTRQQKESRLLNREGSLQKQREASTRLTDAETDLTRAKTKAVEEKTNFSYERITYGLKLFAGATVALKSLHVMLKTILPASYNPFTLAVADRSATAWEFVQNPMPLCKARCDTARCTTASSSRHALVPALVVSELNAISKLVCAAAIVEEVKNAHGLATCILTWVQNQNNHGGSSSEL